jgi:2',3'-cyclic-nucleotide 2'-phosphodiesterase (5'-nucleotidase family)
VFDVNGVKVGVLGITQVGTLGIPDTHPDNVKGLSFSQPEDVIPQYKWLAEQCDVNVLLTHIGYEVDVELAKKAAGEHIVNQENNVIRNLREQEDNGAAGTENGRKK